MDEITRKKQFLQLQFCVLLLACSTLPDFGNMIASAIGLGGLSIPVIIARVIGIIGGGMALFAFYKDANGKLPIPFLCAIGGGIVIALITLIPGTPMWLDYIALIALFVGLYLSKDSLGINWKMESSQGAYLILLTTLIHLYYNIDSKIATAIAALVALIIYLKALGIFGRSMDEEGSKGVSKLKTAAWIGIVASAIKLLLGWIPLIGFVITILVCIVNIVAFVFEFMGYGNLTRSATVGGEGQIGAGKLRTSMIIGIVAAVLGTIPIIGIVGGLLSIVALWFVFQGWIKIILGLEQA